jgi:hypothetical protein
MQSTTVSSAVTALSVKDTGNFPRPAGVALFYDREVLAIEEGKSQCGRAVVQQRCGHAFVFLDFDGDAISCKIVLPRRGLLQRTQCTGSQSGHTKRENAAQRVGTEVMQAKKKAARHRGSERCWAGSSREFCHKVTVAPSRLGQSAAGRTVSYSSCERIGLFDRQESSRGRGRGEGNLLEKEVGRPSACSLGRQECAFNMRPGVDW